MQRIRPWHDTPIGTVHPYWARKPMNILEEIIEIFTDEGDLVVDPFAGSGTTLFAAVKNQREGFGSDLSNLSNFLVCSLIEVVQGGDDLLSELRRIIRHVRNVSSEWFAVNPGVDMERVRYHVSGSFENGAFELLPTELIAKEVTGVDRWARRLVLDPDSAEARCFLSKDFFSLPYLHRPIDFETVALKKNSRIAIPAGARLSHFFTPLNQATVNLYIDTANASPLREKYPHAIMLILSASLPMLRLSDRKASSQWPFWRPKKALTSRNPNMVFRKKLDSVLDLAEWSRSQLPKSASSYITMRKSAAQDLTADMLPRKARLVLTDPPYGDQVPYLEYSNLWNALLGTELTDDDYSRELVKSDAKFQENNGLQYQKRLSASLEANLKLLSPENGVLVWFYQDHDLANWEAISSTVKTLGFDVADVISIPKQRRSLKTVTTPKRTLDGDLVVVIVPSDSRESKLKVQELRNRLEQKLPQNEFYTGYSRFIRDALIDGNISDFSKKYRTVSQAMKGDY